MRLIDADALKKQFWTEDGAFIVGNSVRRLTAADDLIDDMPTIDAVPVVRCADCQYRDEAKVNKKGFLICPASGMEITDDDFCSCGERRSE